MFCSTMLLLRHSHIQVRLIHVGGGLDEPQYQLSSLPRCRFVPTSRSRRWPAPLNTGAERSGRCPLGATSEADNEAAPLGAKSDTGASPHCSKSRPRTRMHEAT